MRTLPVIPAASIRVTLGRIVSVAVEFAKAHSTLLVAVLCVLAFLALIVIPWVIITLPEDYFIATDDSIAGSMTLAARIGRNILGWFLMIIGLALVFPPGLGTIFIVAGIVLMDFPHKRAIERRAAKWRGVLPILNAIRRLGKVPRFRRLP